MAIPNLIQPWLDLYDGDVPQEIKPSHDSVVSAFRFALERDPGYPAIRYFDATLTLSELDIASNALACALEESGFSRGDRLAIYLQNVPEFVIAALAAWKRSGVVVTVNPMYQARELHEVLKDSGARVLVCHADDKLGMAKQIALEAGVERILVCEGHTGQPKSAVPEAGNSIEKSFENLISQYRGRAPRDQAGPGSQDVATLIYTSGTTGPLKAAVSTHANVAQSAEIYRCWAALTPGDTVAAIAPLVHVTGMIGYLALALWVPATLVLTYRFDPRVFRDAVRATGATFTIGPTTAFIALLNSEDVTGDDLRTLSKVYSGGAPIPAAVVEKFLMKFGHRIHGIYGMTEATGPTHISPRTKLPPIDPATGTLAVGVPVSGTHVQVLDDAHQPVPVGTPGELAIAGPQLATGYWNKPEETAKAFTAHGFLSGDIGYMDAAGWFYIIDRKKDQINTSGFKVWPREVEDVLYEHPAVAECAVIGVPDSYRGEVVAAFVVARKGMRVTRNELEEFCNGRLARYKVPRVFTFLDELPKTASGKILRRELRASASGTI